MFTEEVKKALSVVEISVSGKERKKVFNPTKKNMKDLETLFIKDLANKLSSLVTEELENGEFSTDIVDIISGKLLNAFDAFIPSLKLEAVIEKSVKKV